MVWAAWPLLSANKQPIIVAYHCDSDNAMSCGLSMSNESSNVTMRKPAHIHCYIDDLALVENQADRPHIVVI
jgi:hypothetical protein